MPAVTQYEGIFEGAHYSSLYPHLFRVRFNGRIAGRSYDVDKIVSAADEHHARQRAASGGMTVYGGIDVEQVYSLSQVA